MAAAAIGVIFAAGCAPLRLRSGSSPTTTSTAPAPMLLATTPASSAPRATGTAEAFALNLTPLPTETALPTLALPTEVSRPAGLSVWDGLPTYLAESEPDYYFRLSFDPSVWALTRDQFGNPVLAARDIPGCTIAPSAGRGLPLSATVDHDVRRIGAVTFQVSAAYINGVKQFVNYSGGDGTIYTAFQVSFRDQADLCLAAAEAALGSLISIPVLQATPITAP